MVVVQANEKLYHDWHLTNAFLLLAIKIFDCLHQQVKDFFHWYAYMTWSTKNTNDFLMIVLCVVYRQKVSIVLQKLRPPLFWDMLSLQVKILVGLFLFQVSHPSLSEMFLVIGGAFETWYVPLPLSDLLWVLLCWLRFGSSLFLLFPFCWAFCSMEFARISSSHSFTITKEFEKTEVVTLNRHHWPVSHPIEQNTTGGRST